MHSRKAQAKGDVSTLPGRGHFYFALTGMSTGMSTQSRNVLFPAK
jgi:hypothetical protein